MLKCVPIQINVGESVFVSQFFVAGRNIVHLMAVLPMFAMYYGRIPELWE